MQCLIFHNKWKFLFLFSFLFPNFYAHQTFTIKIHPHAKKSPTPLTSFLGVILVANHTIITC